MVYKGRIRLGEKNAALDAGTTEFPCEGGFSQSRNQIHSFLNRRKELLPFSCLLESLW
jgi:hypothetical protein